MSRLIARHLRFVPTAKSDTLEFEARDFHLSFSFSLLFFSFSRITPELRKSHASQWNNPERLRPELRGLIGFRPDFSGFRGPTSIPILKFVQFQDKLIPNYISDSNFSLSRYYAAPNLSLKFVTIPNIERLINPYIQ